jgi:tripartite-type tricarboxylate transporter receptor subunit TctC
MATTLRQSVVVENVSGGGTAVATGRVARAIPDGHTLLVHQLALASNAAFLTSTNFNVVRDLAGVGLINFSPTMLVGRKSLPANSIAELSDWIKKPGQRAKFAHPGIGSTAHFSAVLFAQALGAQVDVIPYRGGAPAIADIIAGHVDLYFTVPAVAGEHIKAGTVKGFAIASKDRVADFPDLPSLPELGFKDVNVRFWQGMFAPAATPKSVLEKLNAALQLALADAKVVNSFEQSGFLPFPKEEQTPAAADALLQAEVARWGDVVRTNNIVGVQ